MAHFLEPSTAFVTYRRGEVIYNHPVNVDRCTSVRRDRYSWYPDNTGLPSIEFEGLDTRWVYETDATRDADYQRVLACKR